MSTYSEELDFQRVAADRFLSDGLGATARPLNAYGPCWCGSGRKWKFCHRIRESESRVPFGALMSLVAKAESAWVRDSHTCLHPLASPSTCSSKVIDSHTVQRKGGLAAIAENNHVLSPKKGVHNIEKNGGKIVPARIGLRDASTFPGFCNAHDTQMFKPVEQAGATLDRMNAFLLSFRAIGYEYVMKQFNLASYPVRRDNTDRGFDFQRQVYVQETLYGYNEGAKLAIEDIIRLKAMYNNAYKSGELTNFKAYAISLDSVLPFVASGAFLPESDFSGNALQSIGIKAGVDEIAFNVTVLGNVSVAVFGWWGKPDGPSSRFVDSFENLPNEDKATALAVCAFEYLENLYFRDSWWNSLSADEQRMCDKLIHEGMGRRSPSALRDRLIPRIEAKLTETLDFRT